MVYTNTIIHLSVGESGGYLPPLRWIIVKYSDFTPRFSSLSALHNMATAAEQLHSVLVERLFLGCSSSTLGFTAYGTASKVFGLELETLLSDYERYRFEVFC